MTPDQLKEFKATVNIGGWLCQVEVTPYAWMYPSRAQDFIPVKVIAPVQSNMNGAWEEVRFPVGGSLRAKVQAWAKSNQDALQHCPRCEGPAWNRQKFPSQYRDALCEDCWQADFKVRMDKLNAEIAADEKKQDLKHKKEGFTHKTTACVHPKAGGDDYFFAVYSKGKLSDLEIQGILRKKGSSILTDFHQTAL